MLDQALCDSLGNMVVEFGDMRLVKLRVTGREDLRRRRAELQRQFDDVDVVFDDVTQRAPDVLERQLNAFADAERNLGLAVEDYLTTDRVSDAEAHVKKALNAFARALRDLRAAAGCPG